MSDDATRCPTCGQHVEVVSAHEGTSYYVGRDEQFIGEVRRVLEEMDYWPSGAIGAIRRMLDEREARA